MKRLLFFLLMILLLANVSALNLQIEKTSSNEVMILGLNQPAKFDIKIKNLGAEDNLIFYTFFTSAFFPKGTLHLDFEETKEVTLEVYPPEKIRPGFMSFSYYIRGQDDSEIKNDLIVNIIELKDALEIDAVEINSESKTLEIFIENKVNFDFKKVNVNISSPFFQSYEEFSLKPYERKNFIINIDKEDFRKLVAGFYTLNAEISTGEVKTEIETTINFKEKDILTETKQDYGLIINTKIIEKINEGNTVRNIETTIKKGIISRLFTSFSPEPDLVNREKGLVYYTWKNELKPGESFEIKIKTNWFLPFIIILFIVGVVFLTKIVSNTNLVLRKRVQFVRVKGGEFALKVSIFVSAKKYVEKINIIDRLPPLVKIHEEFGIEKPVRFNEKTRKIEWDFEKLEAGETRILSYVVYSKIGILGKFALPSASAIYERDGKVFESSSNRSFFMAEQRKKELE